MSGDQRHDYGRAGCAEGCANRGATLLMALTVVAMLFRKGRN